MNSKVLMVVALLFAGSVSAIDNTENIPSLATGKTWFGDTFKNWKNPFAPVAPVVPPVVAPTRYARFKAVVVNNPYKTGAAVVVTVAVIAAVIAYANSANDVAVEESDENYF